MNKKTLQAIKKIYQGGGNIIQSLKNHGNFKRNTLEMIMISYDFQSGSYIKETKENSTFNEKYTKAIARVINGLDIKYDSILEVGVGEATTLANLVPKLEIAPKKIYGFDLSWSRIRYAIEYARKKKIKSSLLFVADLFDIPLADNSIDIVYTSHSIEPNSGKEKKALRELIRVTKQYLVLLEPAYEFASLKARKRMEKHGYIKNLYSSAISLGLNVIEHRLFDESSNPLNPTGLMIIEKTSKKTKVMGNPFICPIAKTPLGLIRNSYFSKESLLVYPIIDGVPCLLKDNAVIATHYTDDFKNI